MLDLSSGLPERDQAAFGKEEALTGEFPQADVDLLEVLLNQEASTGARGSAAGFVAPAAALNRLPARELLEALRAVAARHEDIVFKRLEELVYETPVGALRYDFCMIRSKHISRADHVLLIRAGIHGNEVGGPLTILNRLEEIIEYAHGRGVKLVIFPLDNPSGYDYLTRFNVQVEATRAYQHPDFRGNNTYVYYKLADGTTTDDIGDGIDPLSGKPFELVDWRLPTEVARFRAHLPNETLALIRAIKTPCLRQVVAALDLHQDGWCRRPLTYHFTFGNDHEYTEILADSVFRTINLDPACGEIETDADPGEEQVLLLTNSRLDAHPYYIRDCYPEIFKLAEDENREFVERVGLSTFHLDGSLHCLFERMGVKHAVTVETSTVTPQVNVDRVHMAWIRGMVDLIAAGRAVKLAGVETDLPSQPYTFIMPPGFSARSYRRSYESDVELRIRALAQGGDPDLKVRRLGEVHFGELTYPIYQIIAQRSRRAGDPPPRRFLITAGIHGDEPAGVHAALEFVEEGIRPYLDECEFVIYPCLNPSGYDRADRMNLHQRDLNRSCVEKPSEVELQLLFNSLKSCDLPFDLAIDLHEDDRTQPSLYSDAQPPQGIYIYESCPPGEAISAQILAALPPEMICKSELIYGDRCESGILLSQAFTAASVLAAKTDLEQYLFRKRLAHRAVTIEIPGEDRFERRVQYHLDMLAAALQTQV